ncbi:MAG: hypothetical protein ACRENH_13330, partial [Gemmatimonadaceae bacterium]
MRRTRIAAGKPLRKGGYAAKAVIVEFDGGAANVAAVILSQGASMFRVLRLITATSFATATLAATVQAQTASASAFTGTRTSATVQRRTGGSPTLTLYGGLATGDN